MVARMELARVARLIINLTSLDLVLDILHVQELQHVDAVAVVELVVRDKEVVDGALLDARVLPVLECRQLLMVLELILREHVRLVQVVIVQVDELGFHDALDWVVLRLLVEVASDKHRQVCEVL